MSLFYAHTHRAFPNDCCRSSALCPVSVNGYLFWFRVHKSSLPSRSSYARCTDLKTYFDKMYKYALLVSFFLAASFLIVTAQQQADLPVTQACLGCICEAISGCNTTKVCSGDVCGPFRITWAYWADGGKHTVGNESPEAQTAYINCVTDTYCAALTVQGYMHKYQQDCTGDGQLDCDDFAAIHKLGGFGCRGVALPDDYRARYQQCKTIVGNLKP